MQIPIVRPELGEAEVEAVAGVIRSGWVAQGPEVAAFEGELARVVGAPHAVAVSSCTAAIELCLRALGVGLDDDVATVSHSFIATANAVIAVGARPIFVDIDPATFGMDPSLLEAALTAKTRAILCVHQLGFPCALPAILDIARRHSLPVIEDAACAIGSEIQLGIDMETLGGFPNLPAMVRAERSSAAPHAPDMETLAGFPNLPAMVRAERSSAAPHAPDMETLAGFPNLPAMVRAERSSAAPHAPDMETLAGFPNLPAMVRAERSSAAPHAPDMETLAGFPKDGTWQAIGRPHGLAACFSFHPRKVITTGEGGMIVTADEALAARLRQLRQHAMSVTGTIRHDSQRVVFESFQEPAYNFRMTDMQAALGRPQLARLPATIATRRALAERYRKALEGHPILMPPSEPPWMRANFQSYPLRIRPATRLSQVEIMQHLLDRGVASRRGVGNAHAEPAYTTAPWSCGPEPCDAQLHRQGRCLRLRHSEEARDRTIMIPLFHGMTEAEQDHVLAALEEIAT